MVERSVDGRLALRGRVRALLGEPLEHFAGLGSLIFTLAALTSQPDAPGPVVVDPDQIAEQHARRTGRAPDRQTLDALIDRHVEREVLFREALALGLGDGDEIVRRRLVQKMTLVIDEAVRPPDPDDATLRAFLAEAPDRFLRARRRTVVHVFFKAASGDAARAAAALAELREGADPRRMGHAFVRGRRLGPATERDLARLVDPGFAQAAFQAPVGTWSGPVRSTFGLHLVRVERDEPARRPRLEDVRRSVLLAWRQRETARRRSRALALLRQKYGVERRGAR